MQGRGCQFRRLDDTYVVRERSIRVRATDTLSAFRLFFERRSRWCSENYREKSGFVSVVDKSSSSVVLYVRHDEKGWLPSASVCTKTCRKFVFTLFSHPLPSPLFQPFMSALSLGWNRIPLSSAALLSAGFSGTMTSILPDISGEIRIF